MNLPGSITVNLPASALLALGAAAAFAASAVLQQRAARAEPSATSLRFRLLVDLFHRPIWLAGVVCMVAAYVVQALALFLGNVAFVEPLIAMELVFALPFAVESEHRQPEWSEWAAAAAVVAGVTLFLATARPTGGTPNPGNGTWVLLGVPCAGAIVASVILAGAFARYRASLLAAAAAICFALLALLTKTFTYLVSQGVSVAVTSWQTYALIGIGIVGFLFSQSAYQAGSLESSLPIIDSVEPTVAVLLGVLGFNEHVRHDALALFTLALGGFLAVGGVFVLGRSALVVRAYSGPEAAHGEEDAADVAGQEGTEPGPKPSLS
ncbi:MAG TPA: DMT family transporter [Acidimicrobiales bacterium]|jgi:drug/metabolite transporter (DMT)-like permease|nr:DMT family transporter [Acidimicrobiales bacterium]